MDFEWDANKDEENQRKHKVSFSEAVETFSDPDGQKWSNVTIGLGKVSQVEF